MIIRSLKNGEQDACLDLWCAGFEDTPRAYFEKYFRDPEWRPEDTVVCEADGRLVSAVHFVRRTVETPDGPRRMAGLANVTTHPDFRGKGCNTACLRESLARQEADSTLDFSLLGTDIHDYYARFGWTRWGYHGLKGKARLVRVEAESVRPATEADLPAIAALYTEYNRNRPFAVQRNEGYWRYWCGWKPGSAWVTGRGGAVVGYALARPTDEGYTVREIGGDADAIETLLPALIAQAGNGVAVNLEIPPDPTVQRAAESLLTELETEPVPWWMVRGLGGKPVPSWENGPASFFYDLDSF